MPCMPAEQWCLHGTAINPDSGNVAEYPELSQCRDGLLWQASNTEEIERMIDKTQTMSFIHRRELPANKRATYIRVVCADRPEKDNPRRVRWTIGGDRIVYPGNKSTKTADLVTVKLLLNSTISTRGGRFMTLDLSDFYLYSVLPDPEYVRIPLTLLPPAVIERYNLQDKIYQGHVYARVDKGMYGLPQAGKLANDDLLAFLRPHGYEPCPCTPGLWQDTRSDLMFTLVVDDFGVRHTNKASVDRLLQVLRTKYRLKEDWTGSRYCGLHLDWNYAQGYVDISMPGYIERALLRFEHPRCKRPEHTPHRWNAPVYGARQQFDSVDNTPILDLKQKLHVAEVMGTLLYYARAVDCTMIPAIGTIASQQANPTQRTLADTTRLLNYAATHPNARVRFRRSDMILHVESDASYLSETKARSRFAGFHYLSSRPKTPGVAPALDEPAPPINGAVNIPANILREIVSSAAEAELAGLFYNGKEAAPERTTLEELGHPQPPTPIVTDNNVAAGIANESVKQKRSKAMDMRYYWVRDRVKQQQFVIYWRQGTEQRADYFTKHHPASHHQAMRPVYLQQAL